LSILGGSDRYGDVNRNLALFAWLLAGLLVLSALLNGFLVMQQMRYYREIEISGTQINESLYVQSENLLRVLLGDLVAYGQKEPAIYEILKKCGINPPPQTAPAAPAGSPSPRSGARAPTR
jgi:hypothetical protein